MDHFRIGPLEISRVEETRTQFDAGMFYPELARDTPPRYASWLASYFDIAEHSFPCVFQSFVVHHGKTTILIDTCIGNDKERPDFQLAHRLNNPYLDRLRAANCRPEDVDIVLCTHFHVDHVGWNTRLDNGRWVPTFTNARYIFSREEYSRYAPENRPPQNPDAQAPPFLDIFEDSVLPVIQSGQAEFVSGEQAVHELLTVFPAPGHTPGHIAIRAGRGEDTGIFLGDIIHNPIQIAEPNLNSAFCEDATQARTTRRKLLDEAAERNQLLVPGHFSAPHIGRVRAAGTGFVFRGGLE
jgi:glyoxylase-like metal-dependent hydrolase (beta-lactamase superfamily II)